MTTKVFFSALCLFVSISVCAGATNATALAEAGNDQEQSVYDLPQLEAEEMPEYPGGVSAMMTFIQENMKYPEEAKNAGLEGRVLCSFIIDKTGKVTEVKVVRSSGTQSLDDEAVRVVSLMPHWTPGKVKGEPVRVMYTIPLVFRLK